MVGLAAVGTHGPAVAAGMAALVAVGVGIVLRPTATVAVLLCVIVIVVSDRSYVFALLSGLCAAGYLVSRHAAGMSDAVVMASWPTLVGAVGFTVVGAVAMSFPLRLPSAAALGTAGGPACGVGDLPVGYPPVLGLITHWA